MPSEGAWVILEVNMKQDKNSVWLKTEAFFQKFMEKKIVVLGDLMLDYYLYGVIERISPEAPVPIVDIKNYQQSMGGAANVANNVLSLTAMPLVVGIVGKDGGGEIILQDMKDAQMGVDYIISDKDRPTTMKNRILVAQQQIIRFDAEVTTDISADLEKQVMKNIDLALKDADALIIEDYNKGLLTPKVIKHAINKAKSKGIIITVDPKHKNFFEYKDVTVFKPNVSELQKILNVTITTDDDLQNAAKTVFERINPKYLVVTLGEKGLKIFDKTGRILNVPTYAREVYDVSGAGDTVIAALTLCLSVGQDIHMSAIVANHAAGIVCGKRGVHPATIDEILYSLKAQLDINMDN